MNILTENGLELVALSSPWEVLTLSLVNHRLGRGLVRPQQRLTVDSSRNWRSSGPLCRAAGGLEARARRVGSWGLWL